MLIVFRCYCFWMVGSQEGESLLIIYEIAFKTPLENLLHGNKCSRYTWPGKASRCEADTDARGSRPRPRYPCAPVIGSHLCASRNTAAVPAELWTWPRAVLHAEAEARSGSEGVRMVSSRVCNRCSSCTVVFLVTCCCRFLALTSHTGQT